MGLEHEHHRRPIGEDERIPHQSLPEDFLPEQRHIPLRPRRPKQGRADGDRRGRPLYDVHRRRGDDLLEKPLPDECLELSGDRVQLLQGREIKQRPPILGGHREHEHRLAPEEIAGPVVFGNHRVARGEHLRVVGLEPQAGEERGEDPGDDEDPEQGPHRMIHHPAEDPIHA